MISASAITADLREVLLKHIGDDPALELDLTLHVRPSAQEVPHDGRNAVLDAARILLSVDATDLMIGAKQ